MTENVLSVVSVLLVAISMAAGWTHLLELSAKLRLDRDQYLAVQQLYRGWAFLGIAVVGGLASTIWLAGIARTRAMSRTAAIAAASMAVSLAIFFAFTYPANQVTANWTALPADWMDLRQRWEWSHAVNAILYFVALTALTLGLVTRRS